MVRAFVAAKVGPSEYLGASKTVKEKLSKMAGVLRIDVIFGRYDIIVEVEARDLEELSRLVTDKIKSIPNIISTETFICYES